MEEKYGEIVRISTEDDRYVDLLKCFKKNDAINEYVNRTLIENVRENSNVKRNKINLKIVFYVESVWYDF